MTHTTQVPYEIEKAIVSDYLKMDGNKLAKRLGEKYGIASHTVYRVLKRQKVKLKPAPRWQRNETVYSTPNKENNDVDVRIDSLSAHNPVDEAASVSVDFDVDNVVSLQSHVESLVRKQARTLILKMLAELETKGL